MNESTNIPLSNGQAERADVIAMMNARRGTFRDALNPPESASQPKSTLGNRVADHPSANQSAQSMWLSIGKSLANQWWQRHPARIAVRLAESVVAIEAKQHPVRLLAIGAGVGAALVVIAPWRRLGLTSMLARVVAANTSGLLSHALTLSTTMTQKSASKPNP